MDRWWLAAAGAWVLCSCATDGTEGSSAPQLVVHTVGIEASAPATRTELASDGYNVQWSPGDRIGVYVESGGTFTTVNAPMTFSGTEAASSGTFYGELTLADGASSYTLYAYYPYDPSQSSSDATGIAFTLPPQQTQRAAGDSTHLGDSDFLVAAAVSSTDASFPALSFSHAFAVVELDLTASGTMAGKSLASITLYATDVATVSSSGALSDLDIMAGSFTFDLTASTGNNTGSYAGGSAQIGYCGLSLNEQPVLGSDPVVAYLTINPADYSLGGGDIYFVVTTADGYTSTFSLPGIAIAAGQMKVVTQELSSGTAPQPTVSLSSSETANCLLYCQRGFAELLVRCYGGRQRCDHSRIAVGRAALRRPDPFGLAVGWQRGSPALAEQAEPDRTGQRYLCCRADLVYADGTAYRAGRQCGDRTLSRRHVG